ncbi:hypothetical protein CALCODRAFT_494152 [Calocera cornea HHB12733]|uniref:Uncharacterized protein n=1 Tax=Calocera cornea HHB12733 TaxID=1353952 RepID=A0A165HC66_9BASI|nr:hypothetical protein CALCODRAFT_494152 [Calocera cornea HHB12733]
MATTFQMEPSPLEKTTAPEFENTREGREEDRAEDTAPVTQSADTAGVDPLTDTPTTNTTTGGAMTSEPESLPTSGTPSSAPPPIEGAAASVPRQGSLDSGGKRAKVPGLSGHVLENHENAPTFKEKVQGFAKVFRGSTLGKKELKEEGKAILAGERKLSSS